MWNHAFLRGISSGLQKRHNVLFCAVLLFLAPRLIPNADTFYIVSHNPYNLFILTTDYSKNLTKMLFAINRHISMFVVKSIVILIGQGYGSIN